MTEKNTPPPSRGTTCPSFAKTFSLEEGAGNAGCALHPRSRVQNCAKTAHTSIQVQRKHSGIPRAMALRLISCSPRRRIRLVTVAAGLMALPIRLDRNRHRQLGTSNGCRNHTVLPYANSVVRPACGRSLTTDRPVNNLRADAAASTASFPAFVTTRDRPSCRERTGRAGSPDLPDAATGIYSLEDLDSFWVICPSGNSPDRRDARSVPPQADTAPIVTAFLCPAMSIGTAQKSLVLGSGHYHVCRNGDPVYPWRALGNLKICFWRRCHPPTLTCSGRTFGPLICRSA